MSEVSMPITERWYDDEQTIYYAQFIGRWTVEMYRLHFIKATQQIATQLHPVDSILDMSQSGLPPLNMYNEVQTIYDGRAQNLRYTLVVVSSGIIRNAITNGIRIGARITHDENIRLEVTATLQEALHTIARYRADEARAALALSDSPI